MDFRIASITDLTVSGDDYDLTFHYGVSFNSLSPTFDIGSLGVITVGSPLVEAINNANIDASSQTSVLDFAYLADSLAGTNSNRINGANFWPVNPLTVSQQCCYATDPDLVLENDQAWITMQPSSEAAAIPEPGTLTLLGLGGGIIGAVSRRRRRRTAEKIAA